MSLRAAARWKGSPSAALTAASSWKGGTPPLLQKLRPRAYLPSIEHLDLDALRGVGIEGVILDLDNTLVPWRDPRAPEELLAWVRRLEAHGFKACILSNGRRRRVAAFSAALGVPGVCGAKPGRAGFRRALALLGTPPSRTAVVGDQVFTDVLGGNRLGLHTILVAPRSARELGFTRLMRLLEALVLRAMARRGWVELLPRPSKARAASGAE
ncbi:MAG: YqeG family HAD IIIA-type phosphatase [Acetobacteraceae bacterium]|nr:YqeG family HAD IIIA-type phosphatase [Acetobacteraceae bacterium]